MTATIWWTVVGCAATTAVIKAFGPVVMGGRELPPRLNGVILLMAPTLLAALVATTVLVDDGNVHVGADTIGVAAGGAVMLLAKRGVLVAAVVAAGVTAALRLLG